MSNPSLSISSLVFFRKNAGLTQADIATAMSITQSAVARLEKRLLSDSDVTLKTLERYAEAVGIRMHVDFEPKAHKAGVFSTAAEAINFAIHSSACEGMTTPSEDIDNLWRLARGEISADSLIQQYISEAIEEDQKIHARQLQVRQHCGSIHLSRHSYLKKQIQHSRLFSAQQGRAAHHGSQVGSPPDVPTPQRALRPEAFASCAQISFWRYLRLGGGNQISWIHQQGSVHLLS